MFSRKKASNSSQCVISNLLKEKRNAQMGQSGKELVHPKAKVDSSGFETDASESSSPPKANPFFSDLSSNDDV